MTDLDNLADTFRQDFLARWEGCVLSEMCRDTLLLWISDWLERHDVDLGAGTHVEVTADGAIRLVTHRLAEPA